MFKMFFFFFQNVFETIGERSRICVENVVWEIQTEHNGTHRQQQRQSPWSGLFFFIRCASLLHFFPFLEARQ